MKVLISVLIFTTTSLIPANAATTNTPNLHGYICIDQNGVHRNWTYAFDGTTFCKLVKNSFSKK